MSKNTKIQWCHGTVNPAMGCDGCELYPTLAIIRSTIRQTINPDMPVSPPIADLINDLTRQGPQSVKLDLKGISETLAREFGAAQPETDATSLAAKIEKRVSQLYTCYASTLHRAFNSRGGNPGYAYPFEQPKLFPGRVAAVAQQPPPTEKDVAKKPWLHGYRRLTFISDMGDALSADVSFEFLHEEVIQPVRSDAGQNHIWLWLSKRPRRMAEFADWLGDHGVAWPDNLVAMTSVTGPETTNRVTQLTKVPARYRALSVEPLRAPVRLPLNGIDWVIVGGESGTHARPFHLEWAEQIREHCKQSGAAFFLKQLGSRPALADRPLKLNDAHGGEWSEWPEHLRVRNLPPAWRA